MGTYSLGVISVLCSSSVMSAGLNACKFAKDTSLML